MALQHANLSRIGDFLERISKDIYPEYPSITHTEITIRMIEYFMDKYPLEPNSEILDVGCGQGVALELFTKRGYRPIGITMDAEDYGVCRDKGFTVYQMDQSFLDFPGESFPLVWCRHCLEHSIFPYFTISEFCRVLQPKGFLYVEVPAPETGSQHETGKNHYSVMGKRMWVELLRRSGFEVLDVIDIHHKVPRGPDLYFALIQRKI